MLSDDAIARLRDDLTRADYTLAGVGERLTASGLAGLVRNSGVAARRALGNADDAQAVLTRLWLLGEPVTESRLRGVLTGVDDLLGSGLLLRDGPDLRADVELKPYGDDTVAAWICSDPTPLDAPPAEPRADFVLGASPASTTLAQLIPRRRVGTALDLGTGCGIQTLHLVHHCETIVATDLNPRALDLARITTGLAGIDVDLRLGSLYEPVAGQGFDLIVTNPPFVMSPPDGSRLVYREAGLPADQLMREVVTAGAARLNPDGLLVVLGNWAIAADGWMEHLADWIRPTGCDALVLQREQLDPYEYIELWLVDAGLAGSANYRARYSEWLDYFAGLGITGAGMGWIVLKRSGREQPEVRLEEWPHVVHQPVAQALADFFDDAGHSGLAAPDLLATCWRHRPGVVRETFGEPGAADPAQVVLRQQYGLGRATMAGTALAAVVGACDGELPAATLVAAVADLLGADVDALTAELLPQLRTLVADGYLTS